jgi:hypothetical protein
MITKAEGVYWLRQRRSLAGELLPWNVGEVHRPAGQEPYVMTIGSEDTYTLESIAEWGYEIEPPTKDRTRSAW